MYVKEGIRCYGKDVLDDMKFHGRVRRLLWSLVGSMFVAMLFLLPVFNFLSGDGNIPTLH